MSYLTINPIDVLYQSAQRICMGNNQHIVSLLDFFLDGVFP
jgi:hypothetical protein